MPQGNQLPSSIVNQTATDQTYNDAYVSSAIDTGVKKRKTAAEKAAEQQQNILKQVGEIHGDIAVEFVKKPIREYNEYDWVLAKLNPDLFTLSKKYDELQNVIDLSKSEEENLKNAQRLLFGLGADQMRAIERTADQQKTAIAMQKSNQIGALQGMAGAAGATAGQMGKIVGEITNQFMPQTLSVEAQKQQGLANVAASMMQIPSVMAGLRAQALQSKANEALLEQQKKRQTNVHNTNVYKAVLDAQKVYLDYLRKKNLLNQQAQTQTQAQKPQTTTNLGMSYVSPELIGKKK